MLNNYAVSHKATVSKDGKVYVPECIRQMLPKTLCAVVEERDDVGKCIAFYSPMNRKAGGSDVIISDGYVDVQQMQRNAGLKPPLTWRALISFQSTLEELLLHHDDSAGCYKAIPHK
ncbi:MAG: hypothetical protein QXT19_04155 [Candidatus Woesearchaeota archaeon]